MLIICLCIHILFNEACNMNSNFNSLGFQFVRSYNVQWYDDWRIMKWKECQKKWSGENSGHYPHTEGCSKNKKNLSQNRLHWPLSRDSGLLCQTQTGNSHTHIHSLQAKEKARFPAHTLKTNDSESVLITGFLDKTSFVPYQLTMNVRRGSVEDAFWHFQWHVKFINWINYCGHAAV
jgi:hypothetical protein